MGCIVFSILVASRDTGFQYEFCFMFLCMFTNSYPNKKSYFKNTTGLLGGRYFSLESVKIEYSAFALVLFDKQIKNLIHCPVTAKGSYTLPETVSSIGIEAFSQCRGLSSIDFSPSLRTIGCLAFENCIGLSSIIIPGSVTDIGYRAFSNCTGLQSIYLQSSLDLDVKLGLDLFYNVDKTTCILYVPAGTKSYYLCANQFKEFENIRETVCFSPFSPLNWMNFP